MPPVLRRFGARGVGFGLGIQHEHVPQWLIYQCEAVGLPLFTVPLATPFIAISKTIARGISDDTHRNVEQMYRNQQRLLRSVHSLDPVSTIISRLAELIGGWTTLLNPAGCIIESSHHTLPVDMDSSSDMLAFSILGETKFTVAKGYDIAIFHVASPNRQTLGYLVAGRKGERGAIDHPLVAEAASLLSLAVNSEAASNRALTHLRSSMTRPCPEGDAIGASFRGRHMERAASATVGRIAHYRTAGCVGRCRPAVRAVPTYDGEERQSCGVRHCGRRYVGDRVAIECGDADAAADPYGSTDRGPILRCDLDRYAPCVT